jgi:hypothetical protein
MRWLLVLLFACSSETTAMPDGGDTGPTRGMWRLDLSNAGAVTIDEVTYLDVPVAQDPMPPLAAQYMAVAYAGAEIRAVVPLAFDTQAVAEGDGSPTMIALPDATASIFVEADAAIDHIDIIEPTGNVLATASTLPRARTRAKDVYLRGHVRVLGPDDMSRLPRALRSGILSSGPATADAIDDATPDMLAALEGALGLLAPGPLDAVQTIAVVKLHDGGADPQSGGTVLGVACDSTFIVSEVYFTENRSHAELGTTMVHEAAHVYQNLLDAAGSYLGLWSEWPADLRGRAAALIAKYRLGIGIVGLFGKLQASGVSANIAIDYTGNGWTALDPPTSVAGGFATNYGSTNAVEDIAEIVASIQYPDGAERNLAFCPTLRAYGPQLLDKDALPYAKGKLLAALGFIDPTKLDACFGGLSASQTPGLHLGITSNGDRLDLASASSAVADEMGPHVVVTATGAGGFIAKLHFRADVAQGVGLHRLDATLDMPNPDGDKLEITGTMSGDHRTSGSGVLIVTAADAASAEGLLFLVDAENDFGFPTDTFAFSTFRVP